MFDKIKRAFETESQRKKREADEEEARIQEEEKKQAAKEAAAKRKKEREEQKAREEAERIEAERLAEIEREREEKEAAQKAYLEKLEREKKLATDAGEPWVALVNMDVDYADLNNGAFELDWNDAFAARLMKFGYQGKTDADLVDQWFTDVCRNVVLETYEQAQADLHPVKRSDLGDGKREYK